MLEELIEKLNKFDKYLNKTERILTEYDKELNKQYKLIQEIKHYCLETHMTIPEYEKLVEMIGE